jgi:type VI secretion system protein VasJ
MSGPSWWWTAAGKHPVARDYVRLGHLSPFADGFADWVRNGYRNLNLKENKPFSAFRSWRFWARGFGRDALACGVVRDSSDAMGRQYPLLIMGNGPMKGWEIHWDLLLVACEGTWGRMEELSSQRFTDLDHLQKEIGHRIPSPLPEWTEHAARRERLGGEEVGFKDRLSAMKKECADVSGKTEIRIDLNHDPGGDPIALAALWSHTLKNNLEAVPNALFIGGTPERSYLDLFHRPLMPSDFVRLWSVSRGGKPCGAMAARSA